MNPLNKMNTLVNLTKLSDLIMFKAVVKANLKIRLLVQ